MKSLLSAIVATIAIAPAALAQTQLVRGDVDSIQNTRTFVLDCTNIRLVSSTVNLQQLHDRSRQRDIEYEMQVKDVSSGNQKILDVISAKEIPELLDMGNIRLGRSDRWHVLGSPGQLAAVFLTGGPNMTSYTPAGALGTWVLGNSYVFFNAGAIGSFGRFEFSFQPPQIPALVGMTFTSQAVVFTLQGPVLITNPQCKEVRSR